MFAGNIPGRTNTVPLEIFSAFPSGDNARAIFYAIAMTALSCVVVAAA